MSRYALSIWALALAGWTIVATAPRSAATQDLSQAVSPELAAEEKEECIRNLKVIYDAIQAYQFDHKELPNWLSDLVPDYLTDGNVLICPVCRRTGRTEVPTLADPKLACSYVYEFSPSPVGTALPGEPRHTRREWKRRQMGLIGSAVPLVRCRHHSPMLNLGFNGSVYESQAQWELLFTNKVRAAELSLRAIFGDPAAVDEFPVPLVSPPKPFVSSELPTQRHPIDLKRFYTATLGQAWQGEPGDDLAALPTGIQTFGGIEFDVGGVVQLKGESSSLARFPAQVKGIPVHQKCQHLYFLHAAALTGKEEDGAQIGSYLVHLPNSEMTLEIPIYWGSTVRDWHEPPHEAEGKSGSKVVWTGQNASSKRTGKGVRLFLTAWNLAPGVEVDSLDFVSANKSAAPFLLAISYD